VSFPSQLGLRRVETLFIHSFIVIFGESASNQLVLVIILVVSVRLKSSLEVKLNLYIIFVIGEVISLHDLSSISDLINHAFLMEGILFT
jgi:hypothetical protein